MTKILVGTSSWTDKTLIESGKFYPPSATTPEDRLRFYASQFPIVEIDSSYYGILTYEARADVVYSSEVRDISHLVRRSQNEVVAKFRWHQVRGLRSDEYIGVGGSATHLSKPRIRRARHHGPHIRKTQSE